MIVFSEGFITHIMLLGLKLMIPIINKEVHPVRLSSTQQVLYFECKRFRRTTSRELPVLTGKQNSESYGEIFHSSFSCKVSSNNRSQFVQEMAVKTQEP